MAIIFKGNIFSHYGQAYVLLENSDDIDDGRAGQLNGLLGAAQAGLLYLTFGLHTGKVQLTLRAEESAPPVDESWEEIVEAPFTMPEDSALGLTDWNRAIWVPVPIAPGTYRVRFSANNFREGKSDMAAYDSIDHEPIEHYELIFWPAELAKDRIIKVTRPAAQYWHDVAQGKN